MLMLIEQVLLYLIILISNELIIFVHSNRGDVPERGISRQQLENWASKFGGPLFEFGRSVTKYNELLGRFQNSRDSKVEPIKLENLLPILTKEITENLDARVDAIQKLVHSAENRALEWAMSNTEKKKKEMEMKYLNAKNIKPNDPSFSYESQFGVKINTDKSTVHVPTSIYEKDENVLEGVAWSSIMDETFRSNRIGHPTLNWQYFGSTIGFMRQYPGSEWPESNNGVPDLYDCRFRPWYIGAANRPKNMVILLDVSGSMTGQRREIARHVVYTILDTLTENDFVAVFNFSSDIKAVLPCFNKSLVQANLEYIREIKEALDQERTIGVANFPNALNYAFDVLDDGMKENETSAGCNNAIMIVTDGAPYKYEEIFAERQKLLNPVRIFTYLTGKEVTDFKEVRFMACDNQGYFVHISTLSEVQEQVLKYLPVMSRPLVMLGRHDIHWTPIYADLINVQESDWAWQSQLADEQRKCSEIYKKRLVELAETGFTSSSHNPCTYSLNMSISSMSTPHMMDTTGENVQQHRWSRHADSSINFVVSASMPVFDLRNSTAPSFPDADKPTLLNATAEPIREERIAKFLGVVATDIPYEELKRLLRPFRLGVNGYAFIVNNNGHVVHHPDWRPVFDNTILKPNYNAVDMAELELMDSSHSGRNNDSLFLEMRGEIVRQERNYRTFKVRIHQDKFRRVTIRGHRYEYGDIKGTPYSLVLVTPEKMNRFHGEIEIFLAGKNEGIDVTGYFDHPNEQEENRRRWTINPNWHYCEFIQTDKELNSKEKREDRVLHFLRQIQEGERRSNGFKWRNTGVGLKGKQERDEGNSKDIYDCDKDLMQALVFDANVTDVFTSTKLWKFNKNESQIIQIYGALMAFIATRSGLTRWIEFEKEPDKLRSTRSHMQFPEATDELWYQRAVDRYAVDPNSFVFSVPVHDGREAGENLKVTATRAMYVRKNGWEAPVAVVGIQFDHQKWVQRFNEITSICIDGRDCGKTCKSGEFDCFVLDDNGFILITENHKDVGKFFGQVDGMVMDMLINSDVYKRVRVVDYQAVCLRPITKSSLANYLKTPIAHIATLTTWILAQMSSIVFQLGLDTFISPSWAQVFAEQHEQSGDEDGTVRFQQATINKTKLRPCDTEYDLYTYGPSYNTHNFSYHGLLTNCGHNCNGYFNVHYIPHTNLIMVVTDGGCPCSHNSTSLEGKEIEYPSHTQHDTKDTMSNEHGSHHQTIETCTRPKLHLTRRRPSSCIPINPEEKWIRDDVCGDATHFHEPHHLYLYMIYLIIIHCSFWVSSFPTYSYHQFFSSSTFHHVIPPHT